MENKTVASPEEFIWGLGCLIMAFTVGVFIGWLAFANHFCP